MELIVRSLGHVGISAAIGLVIFIVVFRKANKLFTWIEDQTFGTRNYLMEKFELLFITVKEEHITWALLGLSLGGGTFFTALIGLLTSQWIIAFIFGLIVAFVAFKIPKPIVNYLIKKRLKEYSDQMVDGLTLLSNGIRAGLSVAQSIGMVVDEMPPPISQEFNVMLQQNKIGVPMEECFENLAKRIPTQDNDMFVASVNILKETGGNLAETFDTIVGVIRERVRLQQKIESMVAQGLFQGMVIAAMPYGIAAMFFTSDPEQMTRAFTHPLGIALMVVAFILDTAGFFVILKIVDIKGD